ncbi:MAG: DNA polymerase III subunit alpha [Ruminococcus sp.]|nr:DNA polymerase III subunit alpha [Ruminococcus sp.]
MSNTKSGFVHLHVHGEYSLLDGMSKIPDLVKKIKDSGMTACALTDHGVMNGVVDFYNECQKQGIKPILGCECYEAPESRLDKNSHAGEERYHHLILLVKNETGYKNLCHLVSRSNIDGFYYKPRIDFELLEQYHEGLICLSACLAGRVPREILRGISCGDMEPAKKAILRYRELFGDDYYLEIQNHGIREEQIVANELVRFSDELGIKLVCTNDCHYTNSEDKEAHEYLLCLQTKKTLDSPDRLVYEGDYSVKTEEEMRQLFPSLPQAFDNTLEVADKCNFDFKFGDYRMPKVVIPKEYGNDYFRYLEDESWKGWEKRYPVGNRERETAKKDLEYELGIVKQMGFAEYFLDTRKTIRWSREHGILVGPGRGSAAGSLVAYTLGITQLDPIRYDLLFERFLNPERVSMPDIDVDFCFERRQEVIEYVRRKYGDDCVVQIVTFGTLAARGVIRDVGRVLDMPYAQVDSIAKMIPQELNITIDKALTMNPELKKAYEEQDEIHYLIDMARRLEGLPRHTSMHAAGVVISQKDVSEYVPLSRASDGSIVTQFTMTTLEELGLLKMDFLGLRTLTVIQNAVKLIQKDAGVTLDMQKINYDDKKVLDSLGTGRSDGVFQLESAGMKNFMKELKPQSLEDVIAGISLYRPGPMDFIPQYIRGKNRPDTIRYDCPQLEPILKPTYGCIVYQEQVMQIVRNLAGYTLGRSDLVRRAMSKKKASVMEKERQNFVYGNEAEGVPGCIANGIDEATANKIYDEMIDFAKYAFNKSHAAAYAVVSYQTAYLKYYYPVEFMAALMTSVIDFPNKVAEYILVCRQMGIKILPPDVNCGMYGFSVDNGAIRYGLSAIKSVGRPVIESLVREREENGQYRSLKDFMERNSPQMNKRAVENFIKAGALDCLDGNRRQKMLVYQKISDSISQDKKNSLAGQMSLFDLVSEEDKKEFEIRMPDVEEFGKEELLGYEKEVLGIYLSGHPLENYRGMMEKTISAKTSDFQQDEETNLPKVMDGQKVIIGGMITDKTIKYTKNNKVMAFLTVEDLVGTVEVVVFPRDYEKSQQFLNEEGRVFIQGRVSAEDDRASKLILEKIRPFDNMPREIWIQFDNKESYTQQSQELLADLRRSPGDSAVVIYLKDVKAIKKLPVGYHAQIQDSWLNYMYEKYGKTNVKVVERGLKNL